MSELHSLVDFGICIVLWLVQLVIYPSFLRIDESQLLLWHKAYTFRVSFVIMPLMLTQLAMAVAAVATPAGTWKDGLVLALVLLCWLLTFLISVPLHQKIDQGDAGAVYRQRLIWTNWPRTFLWTLIFLLGVSS
jgi:hypothetical protein